ncbi:MAG: hypothetical protein RJA07_379 [Bacteroidota bacterium]|jgi:predicted amidophosphoribosyltransferase
MGLNIIKLTNWFSPNTASTVINYERVKEYHSYRPKRICFNSTHSNALCAIDFGDVKWALNLPFEESIKEIYESETTLKLIKKKNGKFWSPLKLDSENIKAVDFIFRYKEKVFLKDTLDISMALSEHMINDVNRTVIGELEYKAKYENCKNSLNTISELVKDFIEKTPFYRDAKFICSIPPSKINETNNPTKIALFVEQKLEKICVSNKVGWKSNKETLKDKAFSDKWQILEAVGLKLDIEGNGEDIILIDDLYQSGTTLQFVAMKLKECGFNRVYGLSIVKSRRDDDNK